MTTNMHEEITRLASAMNDLYANKNSMREHHMMSGAFVWDDEIPSASVGEDVALRYILRFRTSLLIGSPIESFRQYWLHAQNMWPKWPGFSPERCSYSERIKREYEKIQLSEEDFLAGFND